MLYLEKPKVFVPKFEVVSCFVEYQNEFLLLLRQDHKNEPNTYGMPAGKVEKGETIDEAIKRELYQETGIEEDNLLYFKKVYVKYPTYDFVYHIYHKKFESKPQVKINTGEHKSYIRSKPAEALKENLIEDLDSCIKMFYNI